MLPWAPQPPHWLGGFCLGECGCSSGADFSKGAIGDLDRVILEYLCLGFWMHTVSRAGSAAPNNLRLSQEKLMVVRPGIAIIQTSSTPPLAELWALSVEEMSFAEVRLSVVSPGGAGAGMAWRGTLDVAFGRPCWMLVSGGVVFLATPLVLRRIRICRLRHDVP